MPGRRFPCIQQRRSGPAWPRILARERIEAQGSRGSSIRCGAGSGSSSGPKSARPRGAVMKNVAQLSPKNIDDVAAYLQALPDL
jgi:hypothetical protein